MASAPVHHDGRAWRLNHDHFEVLLPEGWRPSGDTAAKVEALAPLLGFVRPVPPPPPVAGWRGRVIRLLEGRR